MRLVTGTVLVLLACQPVGPALAQATCPLGESLTIPAHKKHGKVTEPEAHAYRLADNSIVFLGRLTVDADGAPRAYHPDDSKGLDTVANAGSPGNWYGIVAYGNGKCKPDGQPVVQGADDPAPGFYVSPTTLQKTDLDCRKQRRYVDSSAIAYVGLPGIVARIAQGRGHLVTVSNTASHAQAFGLHADAAPAFGRGEGSMKLATDLGYNPSPRYGGTATRQNLFVVFNETSAYPQSSQQVERDARTAFESWGGTARLAACEAAVRAAPR